MAGGEGSRLRPLTLNRPKPLVPVGNRPIMEHILSLLKRQNLHEVVATVHYLGDEIMAHFGDGSDYGVQLEYSVETTPLGTAGSVKNAEALLGNETFVIVSGDALTDCDLQAAIKFHREKKSLATLILYRVPSPLEFGVVITDEEGRIQRFLEKPSWSEVFSDTVNTGMYILEPEVLAMMEANKSYDWSSDIFPKILADGLPIYGYVMDGYWCDVGSLQQYQEAQEHLLSGRVSLPIGDEYTQEKSSGVYVAPHALIDEGVTLVPPVCIGRSVRIRKGARIGPHTVLGESCSVEENATVERSVIWDNTFIGAQVGIHNATVCSRVIIKKDTIIREESVIGDRCLIDSGCVIRPRIKLWPDKIIERGSTVTMSLVWGNRWRGSLFHELGVVGLSNVEITPDFSVRLAAAFGSTLPAGSRVVTSRDSTRSSRMVKRAIISALLSTGCNVADLRSAAPPIVHHFMRWSGSNGAIHTRKLPGNNRTTLIEIFDQKGQYLSRNAERKVENLFFREDFRRTDTDSLGQLEFSSRAVEEYQEGYYKEIELKESRQLRLRVACDYGYSPLASFFPQMLDRLGVESISMNGFNDAKRAPRSEAEILKHVENLREIVSSVKYDLGVLFLADGERMIVVDERGRVLDSHNLFAVLGYLLTKLAEEPTIALTLVAPNRLERFLVEMGAKVIRTKADTRSLLTEATTGQAMLGGDANGGFIFPYFHSGLDAMFAFGELLEGLQKTGLKLGEVVDELPHFEVAYETVRVPWENKGHVMKVLADEQAKTADSGPTTGLKFWSDGNWVLVLPDDVEPVVHVYAEAENAQDGKNLAMEFARKIERIQIN